MTDISDVHHVPDGIAIETKRTLERIDKQIRTHIAEVLWQVNGRPAGIIADHGRINRMQLFDAAGQRIEDAEWFHGRDVVSLPWSHRGKQAHIRGSTTWW